MTIGELRWAIFWRMSLRGISAGAVCGALYGTILAPLIGTIFGGIMGVGMGFVLGMLNGAYLGSMTAEHYYPLVNFAEYQQVTSVQAGLISGIGVAVIMTFTLYGSILLTPATINLQPVPVCIIIPALIASASAVWAARRTTHWYKMNVDRVQPMPQLRDEWA